VAVTLGVFGTHWDLIIELTLSFVNDRMWPLAPASLSESGRRGEFCRLYGLRLILGPVVSIGLEDHRFSSFADRDLGSVG
jgi:hypothetical protein